MQKNSILQAVQQSLPPAEWPFVFDALRQDAILWSSLQQAARIDRILEAGRPRVQDWSPASLALSSLPHSVTLESLLAQPLQPLEAAVRLGAMRVYESLARPLPAPEAGEQGESPENPAELADGARLEQACYLALALREKLRLNGDWQEVAAEASQRAAENPALWRAALAILAGMAPEPVALLRSLIHPAQPAPAWELGLHALLSNPNYPSAHLAQFQEVVQGSSFEPAAHLTLLRHLTAASPELAQQAAAWLLERDLFGATETEKNVLEACQQAIMLAEIQVAAGAEALALETVERARTISQRLQAELESAWAYLANSMQKDENPSQEETQKLTDALRKSVAALPRQPESAGILSETESFLSEVLLQAGDSDETHKWLETLAQEPSETDPEIPLAEQPPALLLQAARVAQQAGEFTRFHDLLTTALKNLEQPPSIAQPHSLKQRLQPASQRYARDLTELTQLAAESGQTEIARHAARLALAHALPEPEHLVALGEALYDEKNPREAASVFEMAVGLQPAHLEGRRWLATALEAQNGWEAALPHRIFTVTHLQSSQQLNSTDLHALGRCAHYAGQYAVAIKADMQAIDFNPEDLTAHLLLAATYAQTGAYAESMEHYRFVTRAAPANPDAWLGLAEIQHHLGQSRNAIETLNAAVQAIPENAESHLLLGQILLREQSLTPALAALERAYDLSQLPGCGWAHPVHNQAALCYGQALSQLGQHETARQVLAELYASPELSAAVLPEAARHYAQVLLALGEAEQAVPPLETALQHEPDQPDLHLVYACTLLGLHQKPDQAYHSAQKVLQADPESLEAQGWMAVALDQLGQVQTAFQGYQKALETPLAKDPEWRARLSYGIGRTGLALGKTELALAAVQEAVQLEPANIEYQQQLAEVFWELKLNTNALHAAHAVLQQDQDNPNVLAWYADQIVRSLQSNGGRGTKRLPDGQAGTSEAINVIRHALELQPRRADLYIRLARLHILDGHPAQAVEALQEILNFESLPMILFQEAANLAEDAENPRLAADLYRRAAQTVREADAISYGEILLKLAESQSNDQNYHASLQTLRQAASNNPADPRPYLLQANLFETLEQPESVVNCLENAIPNMQQPADRINLHMHLAQALHKQGKFALAYYHAVQSANLAAQANATGIPMALEIFVLAAELAQALLLSEAARDWLAKAAAAEPASPAATAWLVRMHCLGAELSLGTGSHARLAEILNAGLHASPLHPRLLAAQERWLLRQGETARAQDGYQVLLQNSLPPQDAPQQSTPLLPEDWLALSQASAEFAQWDQALAAARQAQSAQPANPELALNLACLQVQAAEFQHLCGELEVVTHAPATDLLTPAAQKTRLELLRTAENLLRTARSELQERGMEIGTNNELPRWKMRARLIELPLADGEDAEHEPVPVEIAPWIESTAEAAAWMAAMRRNPALSESSLQALLEMAVRRFPEALAVLLQAALFHAPSHPPKALELLTQPAPEVSPHPLGILSLAFKARLLLQSGQIEAAGECLSQALQTWNDEPRWHSLAASLLQRTPAADFTTIFRHLEEAIRLEPRHLAHYLELGELLTSQAENDPVMLSRATRLLDRAARIHNTNSEIWQLLAQLQARSDQPASLEGAARSAEQSIQTASPQTDPRKHVRALLLRADLAVRQGQPKQALPFIEKAQECEPNATQVMLALAKAYQALGQPAEALKILERVIPAPGEALPLALRRVELLMAAGEQTAALRLLDQVAGEHPHHAAVFAKKAEVLVQAGAGERAIQAARTALQIGTGTNQDATPLSVTAQAHMHHLIGAISDQAGQLDSAIHHLDQAIQLQPAGIESYLELGQVYQKQRQYQKAQQVLQQAMAAAPSDYRTYYHASLALKDAKDYLAAESMLRRAVELAPENVLLRRQLAAIVALNLIHNPRSIAMK